MTVFSYDFAISFATEDSESALRLFDLLESFGFKVFVFYHHQPELLGKSLSKEFYKVFSKQSRFFIPLVSRNYVEKEWTKFEFDTAKEEQAKRKKEYILPVRIDDAGIVGVSSDVGYIDLRRVPIQEAARLLLQKLAALYPERATRVVPTLWIASFGVVIDEVLQDEEFPENTPKDYAHLCDWLQSDLRGRLKPCNIGRWNFTEDSRSGDEFSLRIGFEWNPAYPLPFPNLGWWELLELEPFESIYPGDSDDWLKENSAS